MLVSMVIKYFTLKSDKFQNRESIILQNTEKQTTIHESALESFWLDCDTPGFYIQN